MSIKQISPRMAQLFDTISPIIRFVSESPWARRSKESGINDFALGNPQEMPLEEYAQALQRWSVPQNKDWFAYKDNENQSRQIVAASLSEHRGIPFEPEDIFITNGAFAGLTVTLGTVINPGDEVIFISPPWFFYEGMILQHGGVPVRVKIDMETFDLDLAAIEAAITDKTRAILINSPNNPTGKIYPPETLTNLAGILTTASQRIGHPIYLISDEAYSRIVYDDKPFSTPAKYYPNTLLIYTYGKTLLTPGQRIGYIALPPDMPHRKDMGSAIYAAQFFTGYAFANAILQYALPDIDRLSVDIARLQAKRDLMVPTLRNQGYEVTNPEGAFYLLLRSPIPDDWTFIEMLAEEDILCLPGSVFEMPGYFRISLTANDEMIARALPKFETVLNKAKQTVETQQ